MNTPSPPLYHYLVVRDDLPYTMQAIHLAHAADESVPAALAPLPSTTRHAHFHVSNTAELLALAERVRAAGFAVMVITEPDGPEYGRGEVSFGVEPSTRHNRLRKLFHHTRMMFIPDARHPGFLPR